MKTYTEEEIKKWFDLMKNKYPHSVTLEHLNAIERMMFDRTFMDNSLEKYKKVLDKPDTL